MLKAFSSNTTIDILLIIFVVIALLALLVFSILFFVHLALNRKLEKTMKEFNELMNRYSNSSFSYLESLSKANKELVHLASKLGSIRKFYGEQLNTLQKKIKTLNLYDLYFDLDSERKLLKQVIDDIKVCKNLDNFINQLYNSSTIYNNNASSLITKFRITFDNIKNFYIKNLSNDFQQQVFLDLIDKCSDEIQSANEFQAYIDNENLLRSLQTINEINNNFFIIVNSAYAFIRAFYFLTNISKSLDDNISENYYKLNEKELNNVKLVQSNVRESFLSLKKAIQEFNINVIKLNIVSIAEQIEPALNLFSDSDRINLLIDNGINFVKETIDILNKNMNILNDGFCSIKNYFQSFNHNEVQNKIDDVNNNIKKITYHYELLIQDYTKQSYVLRISILGSILEMIKQIYDLQIQINNLHDDIMKKYKNAVKLIDEIADVKWTLIQFISYIKSQNMQIKDSTSTIIENNLKEINNVEQMVFSNYILNYQKANDDLENIKNELESIYKLYVTNISFKQFARSLIFFTNKYRYESNEINVAINAAQDLYNNKKFKDSVDTLLPVVEHIKSSAASNKIKFN